MEKVLDVKIISPEKIVLDSSGISSVSVPTIDGELTILPEHIPIVVPLKTGEVTFRKDNTFFGVAVSGGVLEVREGSEIVMLVERGELADEIDVARAEEAYKRAADIAKAEHDMADIDSAKFQALMEKELNRINVGKKWRR